MKSKTLVLIQHKKDGTKSSTKISFSPNPKLSSSDITTIKIQARKLKALKFSKTKVGDIRIFNGQFIGVQSHEVALILPGRNRNGMTYEMCKVHFRRFPRGESCPYCPGP